MNQKGEKGAKMFVNVETFQENVKCAEEGLVED